jgi:rare lipoprotein A
MPLGSLIRVVNLENGKVLFVRVTDRGPYVNGRILDVSQAAAARLGMEKGGLAHVQIEIVGERRPDILASAGAGRTLPLLVDGIFAEDARQDRPVAASPVRAVPSDLWIRRCIRRVPAMLAANHTAHTECVTLMLV